MSLLSLPSACVPQTVRMSVTVPDSRLYLSAFTLLLLCIEFVKCAWGAFTGELMMIQYRVCRPNAKSIFVGNIVRYGSMI